MSGAPGAGRLTLGNLGGGEAGKSDAGGESLFVQDSSQRIGPALQVLDRRAACLCRGDLLVEASLHVGEPVPGDQPDGVGALHLGQPGQCIGGDGEVVVTQFGLALVTDNVPPRGPTCPAVARNELDLHGPLLREDIEVPPHGRRR